MPTPTSRASIPLLVLYLFRLPSGQNRLPPTYSANLWPPCGGLCCPPEQIRIGEQETHISRMIQIQNPKSKIATPSARGTRTPNPLTGQGWSYRAVALGTGPSMSEAWPRRWRCVYAVPTLFFIARARAGCWSTGKETADPEVRGNPRHRQPGPQVRQGRPRSTSLRPERIPRPLNGRGARAGIGGGCPGTRR